MLIGMEVSNTAVRLGLELTNDVRRQHYVSIFETNEFFFFFITGTLQSCTISMM